MKVKVVMSVFLDFEAYWLYHLVGVAQENPEAVVVAHVNQYPYFFHNNKYNIFYGPREHFEKEHRASDARYDDQRGSHWGYLINEMEVQP